MAEIFRGHVRRRHIYSTIDDLTFREILEENDFDAAHAMQPGALASFARDAFMADFVVWGQIEESSAGYVISTHVLKLGKDDYEEIVSDSAVVDDVHKIPLLIDELLDRIEGKQQASGASDAESRRRWQKGPNLVPNGDLEKGNGKPDGWDALSPGISYVTSPDKPGRCIRFDLTLDVAWTTGLMYYSDYLPIEAGATYRFEWKVKTEAPVAILFLKCYGLVDGERREVYRKQHTCRNYDESNWTTFTTEMRPRHKHYPPQWVRVDFYAYLNEGAIYFDDAVLKKIADAPQEASKPRQEPARRGTQTPR